MKPTFWTERRDRQLTALQEAGQSASQIAEHLGTTRNAVIARSNRIRCVKFPSDVIRARQSRESARQRRIELKAKTKAAIADVQSLLHSGDDRNEAVRKARENGATLAAIGAAIGVSRERIRQIVDLDGLRRNRNRII